MMPNGLVENFIDTAPTADGGTRFGGTLARTLAVSLKGSRTKPIRQLDCGFIPSPTDSRATRHGRSRRSWPRGGCATATGPGAGRW
ncbi:hypothetical protein [Streptomyces ossamyceticus]|uniref:Uncharacterized protein n=1 Tax=Streptomyces ossamyceticus TaxID=249581 RepID=A0ABV2UNP9_9ACTN